jgi:RHS repeat-associated protein
MSYFGRSPPDLYMIAAGILFCAADTTFSRRQRSPSTKELDMGRPGASVRSLFTRRLTHKQRSLRRHSWQRSFESLEPRYAFFVTVQAAHDVSHPSCSCGGPASVLDADASLQFQAASVGEVSVLYNSAAAAPLALTINDTLSSSISGLLSIDVQLTFDGVAQPTQYYSAAGATASGNVSYGFLVDVSATPAGQADWSAIVTERYSGTTVARPYVGSQEVKKTGYSGLPAGWTIVGLDRLMVDSSGVSEVRGDGNSFRFSGTSSFTRSPGEQGMSSLSLNGGGTYTRTSKNGDAATYTSTGVLASRTDRNGNTLTYAYVDADLDSAVDDLTITDSVGRVTTLFYTSGKLLKIKDDAGRDTLFAYTSNLLTSITAPDPDGGGAGVSLVTTLTYDGTTGWLEEIDRGGETTVYTYDDAGTVASRVNPDSTVEYFADVATTAVPATGYGTSLNPAPLFYRANAVGGFTDTAGEDRDVKIDRFGNVTEETDALGHVTTYVRNTEGQVTSMVTPDPDGAGPLGAMTTSYTYDGNFNLIEIEYPDSTTEEWTWHSTLKNLPLSHTDRNGHDTFYTYDAYGNRLTERRVVGGFDGVGNSETNDVVTEYTYTPAPTVSGDPPQGLLATIEDALHVVTAYTYNARGLVTSITFAVGEAIEAFVTYDYDADDNLISEIDELGRETIYDYDALGRMVTKTLPDPDGIGLLTSPVFHYAYDSLHRQVEMTDPEGRLTQYVYNDAGQLYQTITPDHDIDSFDTVTEFGYDLAGRQDETIDALGTSHTVVFDELGRVIETHEPSPDGIAAGPVFETTYGATGWTLTTTDPLNNVTQYVYSNFGRTVATVQPNAATGATGTGPETISEHDPVGNLVSVTDANGGVTTYAYDDLDRLISVTQPDPTNDMVVNPPVTTFAYDKLGRKVSQTDPLGNVTSYDYDERGRLVLVTQADPDGGGSLTAPETAYVYDDAGQLLTVTNALNDTTTYVYDYLGRMITQTQPDPDGAGPLTTLSTTYLYDKVGNLTQVTDPLGNFTQYAYDKHNNLIQITMPDPDDAGPLASPVWTFTFDDLGNKLTSTDPMTRVTTYEFDGLNRLTRETSPDPDGVGSLLAARMDYVYDIAGNLLTATDRLSHATTYAYDHLHRQTSVTNANSEVTGFTYDDAGNRLTLTDPESNTTTWVYDALNRAITETNELSDARTFEYDNASNLVKKTDRLGRVTEYVYDDLHRRTSELWKNGGSTVRTFAYSYDALGQLLNADDPDAEYDYTYDPLGRVTESIADFTGLAQTATLTNVFDAGGNRTTLAAKLGTTKDFLNTYTYDDLNRLTRVKQEDQVGGNTVTDKRIDFSYNDLSQFDTISRYASLDTSEFVVASTYAYDLANRLSSLGHAQNSTTFAGYDYTYDAANRITSIDSFVDGVTDYTNDDSGQLTAADHTGQTDESYTYDDNGNRVMTGHTVAANNRLTTDGTYNYAYDDEGNRIRRTRVSDSLVEEYHWDFRNRLTSVITCGGTTGETYGATTIYEYGVGYGCGDGVGAAAYNGSGQKTPNATNGWSSSTTATMTISGYSIPWTLYTNHNAEGSGWATTYVYLTSPAPVDFYMGIYTSGGSATYGTDFTSASTTLHFTIGSYYDTSIQVNFTDDTLNEANEYITIYSYLSGSGSGTTSQSVNMYIYDNDYTSTAAVPNGWPMLVEYDYDYQNRLTHRFEQAWANTAKNEYYVYDENQIVLRTNAAATVTHRDVWGPAVDQVLVEEQVGTTTLYPLSDHLGTTRDLATYNAGTNVTIDANHRRFDSFGRLVSETNSAVDLLFGFTGRLFDEVTGLQNNLNRWYDAKTGQWMSEDPILFEGGDANLRRYVGNSNQSSLDPSGEKEKRIYDIYEMEPTDGHVITDIIAAVEVGISVAGSDCDNEKMQVTISFKWTGLENTAANRLGAGEGGSAPGNYRGYLWSKGTSSELIWRGKTTGGERNGKGATMSGSIVVGEVEADGGTLSGDVFVTHGGAGHRQGILDATKADGFEAAVKNATFKIPFSVTMEKTEIGKPAKIKEQDVKLRVNNPIEWRDRPADAEDRMIREQ